MKLSKVMLAVAALAVGSAAVAAPANGRIAYSAGASATKGNLKTALTTLCTTAGGTLTEFGSGNVSTYACNASATALTAGSAGTYASSADGTFKNFAGTSFAELRLNVAAGSFSAVRGLNAIFIDDTNAALKFRDPILNAERTKAELVSDRPGAVYVGGLLDVEPQAFPAAVLTGLQVPVTPSVGIQQAFGVAVSIPLYTEMFNSQKSAGNATIAKPIPSTCAVTDTSKLECVPTISKGQMASVMSATDTNAAYTNGVNFLASTVASAGSELRYIRRVDTSGTQASAQNYFLGLPCSAVSQPVTPEPLVENDEIDAVVPVGFLAAKDLKDVLIGAIRVLAAPGTGDVRAELSKSTIQSGSINYAIGVMSGENNQTIGNLFRWLRVQGAPMSENSAPNNGQFNRAAVINGSYDFYFESVYAAGPAANTGVNTGAGSGIASTFWGPVSNTLKTLPGTGLVRASDQLFTKGGASCAASTAN